MRDSTTYSPPPWGDGTWCWGADFDTELRISHKQNHKRTRPTLVTYDPQSI